MAEKVPVAGIDWPCTSKSLAKINGEVYVHLQADWYGKPNTITNEEGSEDELEFKERDPDIFTIEELQAQTAETKKRKRGNNTYACPLCGKTFYQRKESANRHLNGGPDRLAACPTRKADPNDDLKTFCDKPIIVKKHR
ncbi:uncharacterized protein LOC107364538 [Tetranychus urticae]|uniref:uncharacterized protein LOC107362008 n=1 Tax=Tetranychus urticae TaxID=32264 RepID=UPI00077BA221|nr:uncharacterized protein LOC107362008 [Tetranychus urticae]XP_015787453.1 uncharacterized protein LOC107364538 [Tetranychus urticae]